MRAAVIDRFGPPDVFEVRYVEKPQPAADEVLVEIVAAGVNPVDAHNRRDGTWAGVALPAILGSDGSGVVRATGVGVAGFKEGDEVFYFSDFLGAGTGSYAEYQTVSGAVLARKPTNLTHAEAAAVPLAAGTAYEALVRRLQLKSGESLLITGAGGGVGMFAVQLARAAGVRVIAAASSGNHKMLAELGADMVVGYDEIERAVSALGGAVDAALDLSGGRLRTLLPLLRNGGRTASVVDLSGNLETAIDRNLTLHGVLVRPDGPRLAQLAALLEGGSLKVWLDAEFSLEDVAAAHHRVETRHGGGKVVLRLRGEPNSLAAPG
jgi:NADPH:quinone reductase